MYVVQMELPTIVKESSTELITTPKHIAAFFSDIKSLAQETVQIVTLDVKNKAIKRHMISLGTVDQTIIHPRDVFRAAVIDSASSIIMVHNHPSGCFTPSSADIKLTERIIEEGNIMGIELLDHVILTENKETCGYLSLRESGLVTF